MNARFLRTLRKLKPSGLLLDVGFGTGEFLKVAEREYHAYGVEVSSYGIRMARARIHARLLCASAMALPFRRESFDVVTTLDLLEHLPDPGEAVVEVWRVLKRGGISLITTPNVDSVAIGWQKGEWCGYSDPTHVSLLPPEKWLTIIRNCGLIPIDIFFTGLTSSPYFRHVPSLVQHLIFKIPVTLLFGLGVRFPRRFSDNVVIVARKV